MTDRHLKPGFGGIPSDNQREFSRGALITTDGGTVIKVYPLMRISPGQAIVLVADAKVYCLEAAWGDMGDKDKERFIRAATRGAGWIDRDPDAIALPRSLARGGR